MRFIHRLRTHRVRRTRLALAAALAAACLVPLPALAQGVRIFTDGGSLNYWDLSYGAATGASTVEVINGSKLPVDTTYHWRGASSLRLRWTSRAGGDWVLGAANAGWVDFDTAPLDSIVWYAWSPVALAPAELPVMFLEDFANTRTPRYSAAAFNPNGLPAATWTRLVMPLAPFKSGPGSANIARVNKVFLAQAPGSALNVLRTMYVDELRIVKNDPTPPVPPTGLQTLALERHVDLTWATPVGADVESYRVDRLESGVWSAWTYAPAEQGGAALWLGSPAVTCTLRVATEDWNLRSSAPSSEFTVETRALSDPEFLDMIQRATFRYFWDHAHPVSGLARERSSSGDICTSGGSGFGLMAIPVGIERGFITRAAGTARVLTVLNFLSTQAERHWGAFPHWIHGVTGQHVGFLGPNDDTVDIVETSYLAQGLLMIRQYFDGAGADEAQIRSLATQLWEAIEWDQLRPSGSNTLRWGRSPTTGFTSLDITGWNECLITYLLAIASPTHPIPASTYAAGWARNGAMVNGNIYYGYPLYVGQAYGGPMFFAHYSFLGFDPRFKKDAYANYYTHNRNVAKVQVSYAVANPYGRAGYNATTWGLTASDDPYGYSARACFQNDNGTIAPTAALASMPYVPAESFAAARNFYATYGATLWGFDGFRDAFNPGAGWTASDYLAIDQGPIVVMIENHRSGLAWERFMGNPEIAPALAAVGFVADSGSVTGVGPRAARAALALSAWPSPSRGALTFALDLPAAAPTSIEVFDLHGRRVATLEAGTLPAGRRELAWNGYDSRGRPVAPGVYVAKARAGAWSATTRVVRVR